MAKYELTIKNAGDVIYKVTIDDAGMIEIVNPGWPMTTDTIDEWLKHAKASLDMMKKGSGMKMLKIDKIS